MSVTPQMPTSLATSLIKDPEAKSTESAEISTAHSEAIAEALDRELSESAPRTREQQMAFMDLMSIRATRDEFIMSLKTSSEVLKASEPKLAAEIKASEPKLAAEVHRIKSADIDRTKFSEKGKIDEVVNNSNPINWIGIGKNVAKITAGLGAIGVAIGICVAFPPALPAFIGLGLCGSAFLATALATR
jgi:hypothetical protein